MKVNLTAVETSYTAVEIPVGGTFVAKRKSVKAEGVYLKTTFRGVMDCPLAYSDKTPAINLETGQIRLFKNDTPVIPVEAEVEVIKKI